MARATSIATALAGAATLFVASQAIAAEPFNGPYVGVQGGWQGDRVRATVTTGGVTTTDQTSKSGFGYGGQIGYDANLDGKFVLGAEASLSGVTGRNNLPNSAATFNAGRQFGLTARAGVLAAPTTLLYVKGGWENGRFTYHQQRFGLPDANYSSNANGWTLGAGIEQMLTSNISARAEYRHTKFNSFSNADLNTLIAGTASARVNQDRLMLGVNYRF